MHPRHLLLVTAVSAKFCLTSLGTAAWFEALLGASLIAWSALTIIDHLRGQKEYAEFQATLQNTRNRPPSPGKQTVLTQVVMPDGSFDYLDSTGRTV